MYQIHSMKMTSAEPYMVQKIPGCFQNCPEKSPSFTISHVQFNWAETERVHLKCLYDHPSTINMQQIWGTTYYQKLLSTGFNMTIK